MTSTSDVGRRTEAPQMQAKNNLSGNLKIHDPWLLLN